MVIEFNNQAGAKIDEKKTKKLIKIFFKHCFPKSKIKNLSIAFVGEDVMKELNLKYRGKNKSTDILSFAGDEEMSSELIIDFNQIKDQSREFGNSSEEELNFILIHGLLHLLGHDDDTAEKREEMIKRGEEIIKKINKYL